MSESQNIEYKESWRDEYLKWICGFANAQGGRVYIGVNDQQEIVGLADSKRLMEDIPNKIVNYLGIVCDVNLLHSDEGLEYIEIVVESSNVPIAFHGQYHYRSGSTKQELKGASLQQFILKKMGRSWDEISYETATLEDIDRKAVDYFLKKAIKSQRIDSALQDEDTWTILDNLRLLSETGQLKNAALLLFGKEPLRFFPGVEFRIGRFGVDETDLFFQDVVEGNIMQMADKVMALLRSKYLISPIHYEGMQRIDALEIPEDALREMIYNAIVHKCYTGVPIQMWVFNNHVELWNEGKLPENMTIATLTGKHSSHPRNQLIASVFYKAGFIETWGRGIRKISLAFEQVGLECPKFEESEGGLLVTFKRKENVGVSMDGTKNGTKNGTNGTNVTDDVAENFTERTEAILLALRENNKISIEHLMLKLGLSRRTISREISLLKEKNVIRRVGSKRNGYWEIINKL